MSLFKAFFTRNFFILTFIAVALNIGCEDPNAANSKPAEEELSSQAGKSSVTGTKDSSQLKIEPLNKEDKKKKPKGSVVNSNEDHPLEVRSLDGTPFDLTKSTDTTDDDVVDLGEIATGDKGTTEVILVNTSDSSIKVLNARASCGCTTLDFEKNKVLEPSEQMPVTVQLSGGQQERVLNKSITFTVEGFSQLRVPIRGEAVRYVTMSPSKFSMEENPGGMSVTFKSRDNQPFRVTGMSPKLIESFPKDPASEINLTFDWDGFLEEARSAKVTFTLDHPRCGTITEAVRLTAEQRAQLNKNIRDRRGPNTPKNTSDKDTKEKESANKMTTDRAASLMIAGDLKSVEAAFKTKEIMPDAKLNGRTYGLGATSTLFHLAASKGNIEGMDLLLKYGADVESKDAGGKTPIMEAAKNKQANAIRWLVEEHNANIEANSKIGGGVMMWGAIFGDLDTVQALIDMGAPLDQVVPATGYTALTWAAGHNSNSDVVRILIESGSDIEHRDVIESATPLMHAVRTGNLKNVQLLLEAKAEVNTVDKEGRTPLIIGSSFQNVEVDKIQALLDSGADLSIKDKSGNNALDAAKLRLQDGRPSDNAKAKAIVALLTEKMGE